MYKQISAGSLHIPSTTNYQKVMGGGEGGFVRQEG